MGKISEKFGKITEKLRSVKHIEIIIAVIAIAVMLIIYFGTSSSCSCAGNKSGITTGDGEYDYNAGVIAELERKLSQIEGVGEVSVLVNWTDGAASADGGDAMHTKPEGVIIICEGGNNISVKLKLISSVASYFGISENKISVLAKTNNSK